MKFEEKNALTIQRCEYTFVYFLLKNKEVVYVGQTKKGFARPFSHRDKDYDEIKIIYCEPNELDITEDQYIRKYKPVYNKQNNAAMQWSLTRVRNNVREKCNIPNYTIASLKSALKKLNIVPEKDYYNGRLTISFDEYVAVINYTKRSKRRMK